MVPGSAILVGGDPGIGKSTLLLQACASIANLPSHPECYYISGEEAIDQVRIRAKRLQLEQSPVKLTSATDVKDIIATLENQMPRWLLLTPFKRCTWKKLNPRRAVSLRFGPALMN